MIKNKSNSNMYHKRELKPLYIFGVIFSATAITGSILASINTHAVTDIVVGTIPDSCEISANNNSRTVDIVNGTAKETTDSPLQLSVKCNDANGFSISAVGYSNNTEGNTSMISSVGDTYNIATGTATSGSTSNWAMKVAPGTNTTSLNSFNSYHTVPSTYTKVVQKASGVEATSTLSATATYQIFPSNSQAAGTYTGKVKYTVIHPSTASCPSGYYLSNDVCTQMTMQTVSAWGSTLTTGEAVQAKDSRDNKLYYVTKLADGNIWMTQNLDYDLVAGTTLTSSDSDVESDWEIDASTYTTTGTWSWSYDASKSYNPGDVYLVTSGSTSDDTSYNSLSACTTAGNSTEVCQHGHRGNFYNWYAATAGSDASEMEDGDEAPQSICPAGWRLPYGTTTDKSWYDLLTVHYSIASSAAGSQALRTDPLYIPRAGTYGGSVYDTGSYGRYWSSTTHGKDSSYYYVYHLRLGSSLVEPQGVNDAVYGFSVRCVASP